MQNLFKTLMSWFAKLRTVFSAPADSAPAELTHEEKLEARRQAYLRSVRNAIAQAKVETEATGVPVRARIPLEPYIPPPGVIPTGFKPAIATDNAWKTMAADDAFTLNSVSGVTANVLDGMGFPGFPYLTELTQLTEYRDMSERTAAEMTRKWIKLKSTGEGDKTELIAKIEAALKKHHIRDMFRRAAELDGEMGRAQIFINVGETEGAELKTALMLNRFKIKKGSLRGFKIVEPITTYPASYNASNPLAADYYVPSAWFVYGTQVHASRLLSFVSRPLPDLLKPVYNFSGISLSQLAQPYVDYWLGTRDSVGKLLRNFSITVLKTDLDILLSPSGQELINRVQLFTKLRDNQGVFMVNKDKEDLTQLNTPLSGLDKLQAQAQEHMAAVAKTPLVILLGITPSGLNASAEGDIRIYYDYVGDQQERLFRTPLETIIKLIQLDETGEIDESITFDFVSLYEMSDKEKAEIRKSDSAVAVELVSVGVLRPEEVRTKLSADPDSGYDSIDADVVLAPPMDEETPDEGLQQAGDIATDIMKRTEKLVYDGGFRGNQHIGGVSDGDGPLETAMKLTRAANHASQRAGKLGTRRAHAAAHAAHRRALEAHKRALSSAECKSPHVHESYVDAHRAAQAVHKLVR
jgi:phage-related protein (TIGR01555 family)